MYILPMRSNDPETVNIVKTTALYQKLLKYQSMCIMSEINTCDNKIKTIRNIVIRETGQLRAQEDCISVTQWKVC